MLSKGKSDPFTVKSAVSRDNLGSTGLVVATESDTLVTPGPSRGAGADAPVRLGPVTVTVSVVLLGPGPVTVTGSALLAEGKTLGASPKKRVTAKSTFPPYLAHGPPTLA